MIAPRASRQTCTAAAATLLCLLAAAAAGASVTPTRVSVYHPTGMRARAIVRGKCWTGSIAVNRADAYRCMVGNAIYDPCFAYGAHRVGCPIDLARNLGISISVPSFPANPVSGKASAWAMMLSNGAACNVLTGTGIAGYPFACSGSLACTAPRRGSPRYTATCGRLRGTRVMAQHSYGVTQIWI